MLRVKTKQNVVETRGRPKKDRVKVGLSLSRVSSEKLDRIKESSSKTKSKIIEDLICFYEENEDIVNARINKIKEEGKIEYFDFNEIRKIRESKK